MQIPQGNCRTKIPRSAPAACKISHSRSTECLNSWFASSINQHRKITHWSPLSQPKFPLKPQSRKPSDPAVFSCADRDTAALSPVSATGCDTCVHVGVGQRQLRECCGDASEGQIGRTLGVLGEVSVAVMSRPVMSREWDSGLRNRRFGRWSCGFANSESLWFTERRIVGIVCLVVA